MNDQGSSRSLRPFVAARLNRGEKAVWSVGTSQERDLRSDQAPWAQPLAPERWAAMPGPLSELRYSPLYRGRRPTGRRDSRNRPTRVSTRPVRGARRAVRDSRGLPPPWRPVRRHRTNCSLGRSAGSALRKPSIQVPASNGWASVAGRCSARLSLSLCSYGRTEMPLITALLSRRPIIPCDEPS